MSRICGACLEHRRTASQLRLEIAVLQERLRSRQEIIEILKERAPVAQEA